MNLDPGHIASAIREACGSTCKKSRRGAVIIFNNSLVGRASNGPPKGFACDGSTECREACNKVAVHAEERAIIQRNRVWIPGADLIHVKVDEKGKLVVSGLPSCWQCSRMIIEAGISRVWLHHTDDRYGTVWQNYYADEFHELTLKYNCLPTVRRGMI